VQIDEISSERVCDRLIKPVFVDEPTIDHRLRDAFAIHRHLVQNVVSLRRLKDMLLNEKLGDLRVVHVGYLAIGEFPRACIR